MPQHIKKFLLCFSVIILIARFSVAQDDTSISLVKKWAESSFRSGDYEFALENYLQLYLLDNTNLEYNYKIGVCYNETNINKSEAIPYLEYYTSFNDINKKAYYYLGRAYMYNYRFTEAVEAFYDYKVSGINDEVLSLVNRLINMSYYAIEALQVPQNVSFERLDTTINTINDETSPFVTGDGTILFFTSNREYVKEFEENRLNVFISKNNKTSWAKAEKCPFNTYDNEKIVGLSQDGTQLLVHIDGDYASNDIHIINKKGNKYTKTPLNKLPTNLNTEDVENGACITNDGNTLYFSSDRRGGFGGSDIYFVTKDANGIWGTIENIGATINTEYNENFPNISIDGKLLHFSSKGHDGIGGYDIFSSAFLSETNTWLPPRNLGFPINTPFDNKTISITDDNKTFYISENRKEGIGGIDIYKVTRGNETDITTIIQGIINIGQPGNSQAYSTDYLKVFVTVYDKFGNVFGRYSVTETGEFFATLYPGEYKIEVKLDGSDKPYIKDYLLTDQGFIVDEIYLNPK